MSAAATETQPKAAGSSFYAGMRVLPKPEREAMYAIYAFCRAVDDIADDQQAERPERALALDRWRRDLGRSLRRRPRRAGRVPKRGGPRFRAGPRRF